MATDVSGPTSGLGARFLHEWVHRAMSLLDVAMGELNGKGHPAESTVLQAASLLRAHMDPQPAKAADDPGRLLAWQVRKVREYIDAHIAESIRVTDLCALIQRSEGHVSRAFRRTFRASPHAFVIQRRLELAAYYMLETDRCLSEIALACGFTDQAHLCKHFRQATGETPASWRRTRRTQDLGSDGVGVSTYRSAALSA